MLHSIAFAKWFLNKHRQTGILVDGDDFDFITSQLDQSSWDEFLLSEHAVPLAKSTADVLITQLVQKMPDIQKTNNKPRKPTKKSLIATAIRVDASTFTGDVDSLPNDVIVSVFEDDKKPAHNKQNFIVDIASATEPHNTEVLPVIEEEKKPKKEPKKRAPKKQNFIVDIASATEPPVSDNVVEEKTPKKRVPKKQNIAASTEPPNTSVLPVKELELELELEENQKHKIRTHKSKTPIDYNVEVIIPTNFNDGTELTEDTIDNDDVELTEHFIDDVLFYKDNYGHLFDSHFQPISLFTT